MKDIAYIQAVYCIMGSEDGVACRSCRGLGNGSDVTG